MSDCLAANGFTRHQKRYYIFVICIVVFFLIKFLQLNPSYSDRTVIVVLGGGVTNSGEVPYHTQLRLNKAFELYQNLKEKAIIITLSGGTPHKPNPVDKSGFPIWEATAASKKLLEMGVPMSQIYEEAFSLDTLGNAYFLRTVHLDPGRYSKVVVITNDWHMDRTIALFDHVFSLPHVSSFGTRKTRCSNAYMAWFTYCSTILPPKLNVEYIRVSSGISDSNLLKIRKEKELKSLQAFQRDIKHQFNSMTEFHDWLFTKHNAYSVSRLVNKDSNSEVIDSELLKTY